MKQTQMAVIAGVSVTAALAMVLTTHIVHGQSQAAQESPSAARVIPPFSVCSRNVDIVHRCSPAEPTKTRMS